MAQTNNKLHICSVEVIRIFDNHDVVEAINKQLKMDRENRKIRKAFKEPLPTKSDVVVSLIRDGIAFRAIHDVKDTSVRKRKQGNNKDTQVS